ncbi:hypothetical protein DLM78_23220 [Leptospira stimsonii]|uniref:Uncharacterized protein n=1 Tax=Leptospira stimsonii TaxID=2202203 RepID=A0A8B3CKC2_9LEPT|nr:hypothetical protein DLM78_23220 [Leptospira stimsonii]
MSTENGPLFPFFGKKKSILDLGKCGLERGLSGSILINWSSKVGFDFQVGLKKLAKPCKEEMFSRHV